MKKERFFTGAALIVLLGAQLSFAVHKPVFTWQVRGDANYRQGIYDGDDRIAVLDMSTLDEPMQALMVFSLVEKPLLLRQVKLAPGGKPLVEAIHLFWKSGKVITAVLDGLSVEGNGTDRLTVTFTVKDPFDVMKVVRTLTVTYDASLDSYVYDFRDRATVNYPETLGRSGSVSFEYCDPWLCDSPAPSQRFPGMWKGRYAQFAYESKDGAIIGIPHNHFSSSLKSGVFLKKDGIFAATYEPDGCPAIQLLDDTAGKTRIGICPWAYDIHMGLSADAAALHAPLTAHFRFFRLPDALAKEMHDAAAVPRLKPAEFDGAKELPMFERLSGFDKGVKIAEPHQGDIDPWFWVPQDEKGADWDRASGRTGPGSLKIDKETPGVATWYSMCEGQGYFTEPWTPCKGYEISVWVKTKDAAGAGASIGACYHVPNIPPAWAVSTSERIAGTKDWTRLTLHMGPPPEKASIMSIHLHLAGKGTCWFDDLEVKMLK
ncbi:MAG TPA: hypothetical protein PLX50_03055 [Candidatus Aminicenantes bacterium]|nr:hypothetical protein [Candidatus Aminicenantes bacterium]